METSHPTAQLGSARGSGTGQSRHERRLLCQSESAEGRAKRDRCSQGQAGRKVKGRAGGGRGGQSAPVPPTGPWAVQEPTQTLPGISTEARHPRFHVEFPKPRSPMRAQQSVSVGHTEAVAPADSGEWPAGPRLGGHSLSRSSRGLALPPSEPSACSPGTQAGALAPPRSHSISL